MFFVFPFWCRHAASHLLFFPFSCRHAASHLFPPLWWNHVAIVVERLPRVFNCLTHTHTHPHTRTHKHTHTSACIHACAPLIMYSVVEGMLLEVGGLFMPSTQSSSQVRVRVHAMCVCMRCVCVCVWICSYVRVSVCAACEGIACFFFFTRLVFGVTGMLLVNPSCTQWTC